MGSSNNGTPFIGNNAERDEYVCGGKFGSEGEQEGRPSVVSLEGFDHTLCLAKKNMNSKQYPKIESLNVLIVGGGAMGKPIARLFCGQGWTVTVVDVRPPGLEKHGVKELILPTGYDNSVVGEAVDVHIYDLVIIAVPISMVANAIRTWAPLMGSGSCIMDITSIKVEPVREMLHHVPEGVSVVGSHPMFGPKVVSNMAGWPVVLHFPKGRCTPQWRDRIWNVFDSEGALITQCDDLSVHDGIAPIVQGLTHFVAIAFTSCLTDLKMSLQEAHRYSTPPFEALLTTAGRILEGAVSNPQLYSTIQTQPGTDEVRDTFLKVSERLHAAATMGAGEFHSEVSAIARKTPPYFTGWASHMSRAVTTTLGSSRKAIAGSIGEVLGFEGINGKEGIRHFGVIVERDMASVTIDEMTLTELCALRKSNVKPSMGKGRRKKLTLKSFRVLSSKELDDMLLQDDVTVATRDITVDLSPFQDSDSICRLISGHLTLNTTKVEIVDTYCQSGQTSVTFRITLRSLPEETDGVYIKVIDGLQLAGMKVRSRSALPDRT